MDPPGRFKASYYGRRQYPNQLEAMQSVQNMIAFYGIEVVIHHGINPEPYLLRHMSVELLSTYK